METDSAVQTLIDEELDRIRRKPSWSRALDRASYQFGRVAIRIFRITFGALLAFGAYWLLDSGSAALDMPFTTLTLRDIGKLVFSVILGLLLGGWAFQAAFGEGPKQPHQDDQLRDRAKTAVLSRLELQRREAATADAEKKRVAKWYRHGKFIGMLFDPSIARRNRWLPWVAIVGGYGSLLLVVMLLDKCST